MEFQDLQDKTDLPDPKVVVVWMVYLVLVVLLDRVYLDLLDVKESGDGLASSDSQGCGAQRVTGATMGDQALGLWGLRGLTGFPGLMELRGQSEKLD